ncbi:MAG: P-II family nitrogen regulator [Thermotaleaceae bacterium]
MSDKLTKIEIIGRSSKFEELKEALNEIGVTGMTVTQVLGSGMQKGKTESYRGVPFTVDLLPKVKVEVVVCEVPVDEVIKVARRVMNTDSIGDGKIFVYEIANAIRIRTGEEGPNAI